MHQKFDVRFLVYFRVILHITNCIITSRIFHLPNRGPVFGGISCSCKPSSICVSRRCSKGSTFAISMISGGLFYRIRPGAQIFLGSKKKILLI